MCGARPQVPITSLNAEKLGKGTLGAGGGGPANLSKVRCDLNCYSFT